MLRYDVPSSVDPGDIRTLRKQRDARLTGVSYEADIFRALCVATKEHVSI